MARSPHSAARSRYAQAFTSSIFEPSPTPLAPAFAPAGKRRDQTTNEMFGAYEEKDLRAMPKTFVPKDDALSARQKKLQFLSSEVLPCTEYPPNADSPERPRPARVYNPCDEAEEEAVDATHLRHKDLSSQLFGRETPLSAQEQASYRSSRLTPNDFKWHSHPEPVHTRPEAQVMRHSDRAYQEKCSMLFNYQSPQMPSDHSSSYQMAKEEEQADAIKRHNLHYSNLFDRHTPTDMPQSQDGMAWRPRHHGSHEDQIIVHQDWTDSKTELISGARGSRPEHPALRKSDELHQSRVFGDTGPRQPREKLDAVTHDNSAKLKNTFGQSPQLIHQAHLRTSITPDDFYKEAEDTKRWEVVELHISGLPSDADDARVRNLCQGFDLQIVKVATDLDPVRNLCKGRAKVMVRYNPVRDSVSGLVRKLEDCNLRVEM
mmetsp:Transcript_92784/g.276797  ORF Transcript_92784/g.276797 Transcript_92784/m.276797 type:complete len:431 (+) Transcript_92784:55-1347(+)